MVRYPAAERVARELTLRGDDGVADVDDVLGRWAEAYQARHGAGPGLPELDAARVVLLDRLRNDVPPPLPPSASSSGWAMCTFETGLPGGNLERE